MLGKRLANDLYDRIVGPSVKIAYDAGRTAARNAIAAELKQRADGIQRHLDSEDGLEETSGNRRDMQTVMVTLRNCADVIIRPDREWVAQYAEPLDRPPVPDKRRH